MPTGPTLVVATLLVVAALVVATAELAAVEAAVVVAATLTDAPVTAGAAPPQALSSAALPVNVAAAIKNRRREGAPWARAPNPAIARFPFHRKVGLHRHAR